MPSHFSPEVSFNLSINQHRSEDAPLVATPILALILPALPALGRVVGTVILGVVAVLEKFFNNKNQQKEPAKNRSSASARKYSAKDAERNHPQHGGASQKRFATAITPIYSASQTKHCRQRARPASLAAGRPRRITPVSYTHLTLPTKRIV